MNKKQLVQKRRKVSLYLDCLFPDGGVGVEEAWGQFREDLIIDGGSVHVDDELLHLL